MMESDLLTYLDKYHDEPLNRTPFNEVDALLFASLSYPKYHEIIGEMEICDSESLLKRLEDYDQSDLTERKKLNLVLLERIFASSRFEGINVLHFRHSTNKDLGEQFQAVSFLFSDYLIVSFCGTDNTVVGLKEDLDMSYLKYTPSELDAMTYLKEITTLYLDKPLILVGHSKGGRLAISSAKNLEDKTAVRDIYTFDSPNYSDEFYDSDYKLISNKIHNYVPEDSIIGRLINEPKNPIVVKSHNRLIQQHDITSWIIKDNRLEISIEGYGKQATKIVNALNQNLANCIYGARKSFTDTLFGLLDRLDIQEFKGKEENIAMLKRTLRHIPREWKNTPKEERVLLRKILFEIVKAYIFGEEK